MTPVCDSLHKDGLCPSMYHRSHDQGGLCLGEGSLSGGVSVWGSLFWGLCSGESLSWGLCLGVSVHGGSLFGGLCLRRISVQGVSVRENPPYGNERAVRILLECILVEVYYQNRVICVLISVTSHFSKKKIPDRSMNITYMQHRSTKTR